MFAMDKLCSGCQAGVEHDCKHDSDSYDDLHPEDRGVCSECGETYNQRTARLGSPNCPRCDRRIDEQYR